MNMISTIHITAVLILVFCAAVSDITKHKIPNILTITGIFFGGAINILYYGWNGMMNSAAGFSVPMVLMILYILRMLGAGDIKLFMGIGAILGWKLCIYSMALSFLVGGVAAFCVLIIRKNGVKRLKRLYSYIMVTAGIRRFEPYDTMNAANDGYFSMGLFIAIGTVVTLTLNYFQLLH